MNTSVTTKFAALALALFVNSAMLGSVAYMFNVHQVANAPMAVDTFRIAAAVA